MREKQIAKNQADFGAFPREQFAGRFLGSVIIHPYGPSCLPQLPQGRAMATVWVADQRLHGMERRPGFEGTWLLPPCLQPPPPLPSCVTLGKFCIFFQP